MGGMHEGGLPHRRLNPLTGEWVLVSPQRASRPWLGQVEPATLASLPERDPGCYLCPGGLRANGVRNPDYAGTYTFPNDFPALGHETGGPRDGGVLQARPARGECRVLCFSPRHDLALGGLGQAGVRAVVEAWCENSADLGSRFPWVQVFENRGEAMGCSNPHPHGQVWAVDSVPALPAREDESQRGHWASSGRRLLEDVMLEEGREGERIVVADDEWVWLVPFWAAWPFETLLLPRRPASRLTGLDDAQRDGLARVLVRALGCYDRLFGVPFPYSMGWHGAPFGAEDDHWTLHAHFYPPLLRSASVRKFMVGYEMLAEAQRDLTPEAAAAMLRSAASP